MKSFFYLLPFLVLFNACAQDDGGPYIDPIDEEEEEYVQYGTPYDNVPATQDIVMYEVNMRSFSQSGDFQGVIDRLDNIQDLGVNVIWLMPIHPIGELNSVGQMGSPYSVRDYTGVNPELGNLTKLRELVTLAHEKDMVVIIDWIANHTSWDNAWTSNLQWYQRDGNGNLIPPPGTDWLDVAQLNFENYGMRNAMISAMKYWVLEANIDGFRFDAVDFVPMDFWSDALQELRAIPNRELILLAEGGDSDNFNAGFKMNYGWNFQTVLKTTIGDGGSANSIFAVSAAEYNGLEEDEEKLRFTTNHDIYAWEDTPINHFNTAPGSVAAFVLTCYVDGVPLVYAGQEIAHPTLIPFFTTAPLDWSINPDILAQYTDIIQFRRESDAIKRGNIETYAHSDVAAFKKTYGDEEALVFVNVRGTTMNYQLPASIANTTWTDAFENSTVTLGTSLSIAPYEYIVLKSE